MRQILFGFLLSNALGVSANAEEINDNKFSEMSLRCAAALNVSLEELADRYDMVEVDFVIAHEVDLGRVSCSEEATIIRVDFGPRSDSVRGGGIRYVLDATSFEIEEVQFLR